MATATWEMTTGMKIEEEIKIAPAAQPLQQERQPEREHDVQDPLGED